jgi:nucleoside-diphosphate-sugar epimerase
MKVLFIGGTGVISQAVSRLAVERGVELYLFNRGNSRSFIPEGAKLIVGDIRNPQSAAEALGGHEFDAVVNWIAYTPDHVETDLALFKGRTKQYVFISSASAYQKPPERYLITEETPLANPYWSYSRDKIACENVLMEAHRRDGFPVTIVRPSHTYGNTSIPIALSASGAPWSIVDRMRRGGKIIVHGDGTSLWTLTHNTDFAAAFVGLLGHPEAIGEAFHITSDEVLTWDQIHRAIGNTAGVEPDIVHIPTDFIVSLFPEYVGPMLGDRTHCAVFDNSKIKRLVPEFQAKVPFAEGIRQTIAWFERHPERQTVDEAWNRKMDQIIQVYEKGR